MSFTRAAFLLSAGTLVWAAHFTAIYGVTALACARHAAGAVPWAIGIATVIAGAAALAVVVRCAREPSDFVRWVGAGSAAVALLAIVWEAIPVLGVTPCVQ